jgi:hypothetical protein
MRCVGIQEFFWGGGGSGKVSAFLSCSEASYNSSGVVEVHVVIWGVSKGDMDEEEQPYKPSPPSIQQKPSSSDQ